MKQILIFLSCWISCELSAQESNLKRTLENLQIEPVIAVLDETIHAPDVLLNVYSQKGFTAIWSDNESRNEAIEVLTGAKKDGLVPNDYHLESILELTIDKSLPEDEVELYLEILLMDGLLLYNHHLLNGKVNPQNFSYAWNFPKRHGFVEKNELALDALDAKMVLEIIDLNRPDIPSYANLQSARARYVKLLESNGEIIPLAYESTIRPGGVSSEFWKVLERMAYLGYLPRVNFELIDVYDSSWVESIEKFQYAHGIDADGILGKGTYEKLNITISDRIDIIDVNLERLRWLTGSADEDFIVVNIAGYQLYMVEDEELSWNTNVMTGTIDTQTPIFTGEIKYLVLNPTWTVPRSIIVKSMFDKMKNDPDYLTRNRFYLTTRSGKKVAYSEIDWKLMTIEKFGYNVVQEPGAHNALGRVKFIFPNKYSIYLHDTPSKSLFGRSSRAFSHGCIRVQYPLLLAEKLLSDKETYPMSTIEEIIEGGNTTTVHLTTPKRILLTYLTVIPNEIGDVAFHEDVYDRDRSLFEALKNIN